MTTDDLVEGVILKLLGDFQSVLNKGTEDKAYKIIADALKEARREALIEAAKMSEDHRCEVLVVPPSLITTRICVCKPTVAEKLRAMAKEIK